MADEFDRFLEQALSPEERDEDHLFVARVQAAIRIEERLKLERRAMVRHLALELVALAAVAAAAMWVGRAPAVAAMMTDSPWHAALILLTGFGILVALLSARAATDSTSSRHFRDLTN